MPEDRPQPNATGNAFPPGGDDRTPGLGIGRPAVKYGLLALLALLAVYLIAPSLAGLPRTVDRIKAADPWWVAAGVGLEVLSYASYVVQFHAVFSPRAKLVDWAASYKISLAGVAATRLISPGGAGGLALAYWALRRARCSPAAIATYMLAFLILQYFIFTAALVIGGILLRTHVVPGRAPLGLTVVPAAVAGLIILFFLAMTLLPHDLGRRFETWAGSVGRARTRVARFAYGVGSAPVTIGAGTRLAMRLVVESRLATIGALGWWVFDLALLWAAFKAFGTPPPIAVLIVGYFVGSAANLLPFFPAGIGAVDAGLIGSFIGFGMPADLVVLAVLTHRLINFWLPTIPGAIAFFQLRKTVDRWGPLPVRRTGSAA